MRWLFAGLMALVFALGATVAAARAAEPPGPAGDGAGGLAGLGAEDVAALREVREALQRAGVDPRENPQTQRQALLALARVHEALNDWGPAGQQWAMTALAGARHNQDLLADLAQTHAKGGQYHFGGVRALWRELDAANGDSGVASAFRRSRDFVLRWTRAAEKKGPGPLAGLRPLSAPARKVDAAALRPVLLTPRTMELKGLAPLPADAKPAGAK